MCLPSRATLFTGQYPSLHGVTDTDGMAKSASDPAMRWLDPDTVPTLGDWFRAAGYRTHYRGKWHVSHPDLLVPGRWPGTHESLRANDVDGVVDPVAVDAYRRADRLDPFGFSGWIGREPHGADKADTGFVRDGVFAEQIVDLFAELASTDDDAPWLAVASFVNPHDIGFSGFGWNTLGFPDIPDSIPEVPEAPSQSDSFAGRPDCQRQFRDVWPKLLYAQDTDLTYRRLYHFLHVLVDAAIMRILDELHARASPTTPSSCSRPITATCSVHTAVSSRSGTTRTTRRPTSRCSCRVPASIRTGPASTSPPVTSTSCRRCSAWPRSTWKRQPRVSPVIT